MDFNWNANWFKMKLQYSHECPALSFCKVDHLTFSCFIKWTVTYQNRKLEREIPCILTAKEGIKTRDRSTAHSELAAFHSDKLRALHYKYLNIIFFLQQIRWKLGKFKEPPTRRVDTWQDESRFHSSFGETTRKKTPTAQRTKSLQLIIPKLVSLPYNDKKQTKSWAKQNDTLD